MIEFEHEKYGKVLIYEVEDMKKKSCFLSMENIEEIPISEFNIEELQKLSEACVVGVRNIKNRKVVVIKNRYGRLDDNEIEQFILNYGIKKDPINDRFEILDL
jgi:hypothetical protein